MTRDQRIGAQPPARQQMRAELEVVIDMARRAGDLEAVGILTDAADLLTPPRRPYREREP